MPYRCRKSKKGGCGRFFSVKTGAVTEASNLGCKDWLLALFLVSTSLKNASSMKFHRDISVTQRTAWNMEHRICKALGTGDRSLFDGYAEVEETYMGGKRRNMRNSNRIHLTGRGPVGKTAMVGMRDRDTNRISARVVNDAAGENTARLRAQADRSGGGDLNGQSWRHAGQTESAILARCRKMMWCTMQS